MGAEVSAIRITCNLASNQASTIIVYFKGFKEKSFVISEAKALTISQLYSEAKECFFDTGKKEFTFIYE